MTSVRCPRCAAVVPSDAAWCSLCFAPLGASAEPAQAPAPVVPVQPEPEMTHVDPWVAAEIADLPVAPTAPVVAPVPPAPVAPAPVAPAPVAYEPLPLPLPLPPAPVVEAPVAPVAVAEAPATVATAVATVEAPTWPCSSCDTRVDFAESLCPSCGTPFMGGTNNDVSLKVPGVGDLVHMSAGTKFGVMAGGALGIAMFLVLTFLVLGHIL